MPATTSFQNQDRSPIPVSRTTARIRAPIVASQAALKTTRRMEVEMGSDQKTFGDRLRIARASFGVSQEAIAEAMSVTAASVSQWEKNQTVPKAERQKAVADFIGCDPSWLLMGIGAEPAPAAPTTKRRLMSEQQIERLRERPKMSDLTEIPELEAAPLIHENPVQIATWMLPTGVLHHWMAAGAGHVIVKKVRSSCKPFYSRGDYVFFDTHTHQIESPGVYWAMHHERNGRLIVEQHDQELEYCFSYMDGTEVPDVLLTDLTITGRLLAVMRTI